MCFWTRYSETVLCGKFGCCVFVGLYHHFVHTLILVPKVQSVFESFELDHISYIKACLYENLLPNVYTISFSF